MKKLFRMEEWQSPGGMWHCAHTSSFPPDVDLWIIPARLLGLPLDKYIMYIKENYKSAHIHIREDGGFVSISWESLAEMRKFKNKINALARQKNLQV